MIMKTTRKQVARARIKLRPVYHYFERDTVGDAATVEIYGKKVRIIYYRNFWFHTAWHNNKEVGK